MSFDAFRASYGERFRRFLLFNPCFVLASLLGSGMLLVWDPAQPEVDFQPRRTVEVEGWVSGLPERREGYDYFELTPECVSQRNRPIDYPGRLGVYVQVVDGQQAGRQIPAIRYGERVRLRTFLLEPSFYAIPGVVDFRDSFWRQGILHVVRLKSARQIEELGSRSGCLLLRAVSDYRDRFQDFCLRRFSSAQQKLIRSAFLGEKKLLAEADKEKIKRLGIFHLFVVSGFHVSVVVMMLHLLLRRLGVGGRVGVLTGLWLYVLVTGAGFPALRAGIMSSLFYVLLSLGLCRQLLNALGIAGLVLLVFWPQCVLSPGVQFSYLSLAAIGLFVAPSRPWFRSVGRGARDAFGPRLRTGRGRGAVRSRCVRFFLEEKLEFVPRAVALCLVRILGWTFVYASGLLLCGIFIQLWVLPLSLYYSNVWVWTQWLSNLLLVPAFSGFVLICLFLFLLFWLPGVQWLSWLTGVYANGLVDLMDLLERVSWATLLPQPKPPELAAYLLIVLAVFVFFRGAWRSLLLIPPLLLFVALRIPAAVPERLTITMLDVGQGECIHILYPGGGEALIDTGGFQSPTGETSHFVGERLVSRYLWAQRSPGLAYVLLTHPHADHVQGLEFLKRAFPVKKLFFHTFQTAYRGLPLRPLEAPEGFRIGEVEHRVLHPLDAEAPAGGWKTNDGSLVVSLCYRSFSILLTGDIEFTAERALASRLMQATVLKVPHHGSQASSSAQLIDRVAPQAALVSAGRRNPFGHPSEITLQRFAERGIPVYSTTELGSIRIETDGFEWEVFRYSIDSARFERLPGSKVPRFEGSKVPRL